MSDGQRISTTVFTYISYWLVLGVFYLICTGIMQMINILFAFNQNSWIVGFIVLVIVIVHTQAKSVSREVIEKIEEGIKK